MLLRASAPRPRWSEWAALRLWSVAVAIALAPICAVAADHAAEVEAFARITADVRTAAERCSSLSPEWTIVNAKKERLHIAAIDYFAFRKEAADRVDGIGRMLGDKDVLASWCSDAATRYGPQGSELAGALLR